MTIKVYNNVNMDVNTIMKFFAWTHEENRSRGDKRKKSSVGRCFIMRI